MQGGWAWVVGCRCVGCEWVGVGVWGCCVERMNLYYSSELIVHFHPQVVETGDTCLSGGYVDLYGEQSTSTVSPSSIPSLCH